MSAEFTAGFTDAYRDDLIGMLDTGEELSLVHLPDVAVSGVPSQDAVHAEFYGEPVRGLDAETPEGVTGRTEAAMGLVTLHGLDARASIQLFSATLPARFPDRDTEVAPTPEQEAYARELAPRVESLVNGGYHTYNKFGFTNNETGEDIIVTTARVVNEAQVPIARELNLTVSDTFLARTITVQELPTSFDGGRALNVSQSLSPVSNEALHEAATFFEESGSPEGMSILTGLFFTELNGVKNAEVESLVARYEGTDRAEQLRGILDGVRLQAAGARENSSFARSNPEMTLPSAAELDEYRGLLSQMRA